MSARGEHAAEREALGSYALGHLGRGETRRVRRHLAACAECRDELAAIDPVARRLHDLRGSSRDLPTGARATADASRGRRRLVGGVAAAALVAGLVGGALGRTTAPADQAAPVEAVTLAVAGDQQADAPQVSEAGLIAHTWGVELVMSGRDFTAGEVYSVRFRSRDGAWQPAGRFLGVGAESLDCRMQSGLLREDATAVQVLDASSRPVLDARL